ncbi:sensory transduction histidine kinase [Methanosarcina horonobensis HB-1 = JCM 15518]|uniref:Sensory transduction histidine kinase n=1 Tax=Methanosarcina horonobensis HB-1 = JCM 15518 TaxID=1434110 RepID=A0A0E3WUR3_9EURY|nr:ATP-binding protein [Methanosarcina horonobensis]AKB78565.1 sensory transduction histidine kinase [Methanosarcina horonobensis HB-1 = JCM 15518]
MLLITFLIYYILRTETIAAEKDIFGPDKHCKEKNGFEYKLEVSDNGKGIPKEIDFENSDFLGFQLVNLLVEQIDGEIEPKRDKGTQFVIGFSVE